jgi:DNA-binding PadR family transcriptional regulator
MSRNDMSPGDSSAERVKPLTEPVLWILISLSSQPQHGYSLMKDVERLSERRVRLSTGTLYGAIRRLLEEQWIEPADSADRVRDKQSYRLTKAGRARLSVELERLDHITRTAAARLRRREA